MLLVTDYLNNTAKKYADKVAVVDDHRSMTFKELRDEAMHLSM